MQRAVAILVALAAFPAAAQVIPGHRLPEGQERPVRERTYHVRSYKAELTFDMTAERIAGTATVTFTSLRAPLSDLSLDAALLGVTKVERDGHPLEFTIDPKAWKLNIALGAPVAIGQSAAVRITYACHPRVGMYFFPPAAGRDAQAWNYGEGGLHNGWLPIYNDTNDRFAVEFVVTVPRGFTAVSNGVLDSNPPRENADGTRTFRWVEEKPIPNYLMTVDVGNFVRVPLSDAKVGAASVPLSVWAPPGTEKAAQFTFGDTPKMVEFFSERMGYPYPWVKYDQVVLREFAVGAMETTTMTGFGESHLKVAGDPKPQGTLFYLPAPPGARFFNPLTFYIEELFTTAKSPYPVERTLWTSTVLDFAHRSAADGGKRMTDPALLVKYQAPDRSFFFRGSPSDDS